MVYDTFPSWSGLVVFLQPRFIATQSPNCHEDSYVPMASPPVCVGEGVSDGYIPMSPTTISFLKANGKTEAPLAPTPFPTAGLPGDLEPPPINRDLKPRRRGNEQKGRKKSCLKGYIIYSIIVLSRGCFHKHLFC